VIGEVNEIGNVLNFLFKMHFASARIVIFSFQGKRCQFSTWRGCIDEKC